ncbi:hypothetical protein M427DRAFT_56005 [Gonapodya prolifera JEL478]|uniref:Peptidyl-tRNA hydrolase n=1 Tax=Gonapodya prolifera (strain JEL478) TaxID=1344416 RepID=A0A139AHD9_GONPJ|nr:hypothetical protein M427DRAFT_56005 [Gonapodya prolifera JEL478]|eukprot:KXS16109.1 hypothetical protein M427DRAFT_56005 [Gonapodya prolifera JEL478]
MYQVSKKAGGVEISKSLRLIIAKPLSGMNESGGSVARLLQRYGVDPVSDKTAIAKKLMVVFDDLNTLPGAIVVEDGGELRAIRGHKGVESIADIMGPDFIRFRIGIGRPPLSSTVTIPNFVLSPFAIGKETNLVGHALELTVGALKDIAEGVTFGDGAGWSTAPTGLPLKEVVKKAKKKFGTKKLPNQLKEMTGLYFPVDTHGI